MTFTELNLCAPVLKAVRNAGYIHPTPIQAQAIPLVMEGRDIFGVAQTGTGKTAAFALPILTKLFEQQQSGRDPRALILAPTRELAAQIGESFLEYGRMVQARYATVYGGVSIRPQISALHKGVSVLIATPGRLIDLLEHRAVRLSSVETLVLDEADHMLDLGFLPQINRIVEALPRERQTLMFSATLPPAIKSLANKLLSNPAHIQVTPPSSHVESVGQKLYHVHKDNKRGLLTYLLNEHLHGSVLVFTRTKRGADKVQKQLSVDGISAVAIHGEKSQAARTKALKDFKSQAIRVLVATDVASRGIDIVSLPYVVNYDVTDTPETYVHRIGRTGRAGESGTAVMLASREEVKNVRAIESMMKMSIDVVHDHPYADASSSDRQTESSSGKPRTRFSGARDANAPNRNFGSEWNRKGNRSGGGFRDGKASRNSGHSRKAW
ncbi:MAG: DEAD/DEAH box helicase [Ignavibacteria bacterium]|nr:DEAD/DEAH box helicase [Ignavibacteria bacterium]